jgi:hypothetical protein
MLLLLLRRFQARDRASSDCSSGPCNRSELGLLLLLLLL